MFCIGKSREEKKNQKTALSEIIILAFELGLAENSDNVI